MTTMENRLVRGNVTNIDDGDEGYGIDCSGLISSAAGLAGADWGRTKRGTYGLSDFSRPVDVANLEPDDILLKPGSHVVAVMSITERTYHPRAQRWTCIGQLIDSNGNKHQVVVRDDIAIHELIRGGNLPRSLRL